MEYVSFLNDSVLIAKPAIEPLTNVLYATILLILITILLMLEFHRIFVLMRFKKHLETNGFDILKVSYD